MLNPARGRSRASSSARSATPAAGICEGPGFVQVDLALYKNIQLGKPVKGQLRFEVFNVFNRVNFVGINTS